MKSQSRHLYQSSPVIYCHRDGGVSVAAAAAVSAPSAATSGAYPPPPPPRHHHPHHPNPFPHHHRHRHSHPSNPFCVTPTLCPLLRPWFGFPLRPWLLRAFHAWSSRAPRFPLMVTCWFGSRWWFGFRLDSRKWIGILKGTRKRIPKHQQPKPTINHSLRVVLGFVMVSFQTDPMDSIAVGCW